MILIDTSVWIDHFYKSSSSLVNLLNREAVLTHPFIIGELACGNIQNRQEILALLQHLPVITVASEQETLLLIENHSLMGRGIGYIDIHLLASVLIEKGTVRLWTRDKRLNAIAQPMNLTYHQPS